MKERGPPGPWEDPWGQMLPPPGNGLVLAAFCGKILPWSPFLVPVCCVTLGESLPFSGPLLTLKLPPTLKLLILQKSLCSYKTARLLRPLSPDDVELTEPSFFNHGWNEATYLLGRFYSFTIGYKLHVSRLINVFLKLSWDPCPNSWPSFKN